MHPWHVSAQAYGRSNFQHNLWLEFCQPQVSQYRAETFVFWVWLNLDSIMQFWVCGGILLRLCVDLLRLCVPMLRLCGSQWLLSLNPTTILVVLLLGLWLLLGCCWVVLILYSTNFDTNVELWSVKIAIILYCIRQNYQPKRKCDKVISYQWSSL